MLPRFTAFAGLLLMAGSVTAPAKEHLGANAPAFSPESFFVGRTEGQGVMRIILRHPAPVAVHGSGRVDADGTLVLEQVVERQGHAPEHREWHIRRVGVDRYAGSLSDAIGPVSGHVEGNCLLLRFRMKGGLDAEQRLYLQDGGRIALNRMTVRKFGIIVARLDETIRGI